MREMISLMTPLGWIFLSTTLLLLASNLYTLYYCFKKRLPATAQSLALKKALATFEVEGQTILHIERINPDNVFLRSPGR